MSDIGSIIIIIIVIVFRVIFLVHTTLLRCLQATSARPLVALLCKELLQFVDDVIPVLHGERTHSRRSVAYPLPFTPHHYCHGDVVLALASVPLGRAVGTIDICVPKVVPKIKVLTAFALVNVLTDLRRTFHVQDKGMSLIVFYHLSQYLLTIAFAA